VGDRVEYNQTIAILDQKMFIDRFISTKEKWDALDDNIKSIVALQTKDKEERSEIENNVSKARQGIDEVRTSTLTRLSKREADLAALHDEGLIQFDQHNVLLDQIEKTEESFFREKLMKFTETKEEQRKQITEERELLQKKLEALQLKSELELLEKQIGKQGELKSHISGRVVEITSAVGDFLSPGSPVILIQPDSSDDKLMFFVFISSEQVKPVKENLKAELQLSAFPPTKYGKLKAKVKDISPMPLSSSGLMKVLRNDQLVQRITEVGSPFMVKVDIDRNEQGHFKWTSKSDEVRQVQVGMVGQGSIITREEKLIWLLLPQTK
jgi:HlyD family secretion protein